MPTNLRAALALVLAAAALLPACSGDDGGTDPSPSGPGTITITSSAIANQPGKILVITAQPEGGGELAGRACIPITSSSFTVPATVMVEIASSGNPCDPAATTKVFAAGRYSITAAVFVGGSQTPEKTTTQTVEVSGNVTASVDGAALSG
jgi:hypothetical protein